MTVHPIHVSARALSAAPLKTGRPPHVICQLVEGGYVEQQGLNV